jgi:glutamyl-tRNA synthetase
VKPWLEAAGIWDEALLAGKHAWYFAVLELLRPRAKRLGDFAELGRFFFTDTIEYDASAVSSRLAVDGIGPVLDALDAAFRELPNFDVASTEAAVRSIAEAHGVKAATLIHAVRVAVTGKTASPGLFEVIALLGRERTHARLIAARRLTAAPPK